MFRDDSKPHRICGGRERKVDAKMICRESDSVFYAFRLLPREDLSIALRNFAGKNGLRAGFIASAVGSLSRVGLRFAGKSETTVLEGCYELLSLQGTLDPDGTHLHAAISDPHGVVYGGHVMDGCIVRTTMELVVGSLSDIAFSREYCPVSTYEELRVEPLN